MLPFTHQQFVFVFSLYNAAIWPAQVVTLGLGLAVWALLRRPTAARGRAIAAILAVGTCATYGGIHAMAGNPTGAMGVPDYLGWDWKSKAGLPIVCVPGCPIHPDNLSETITYLLYMATGQAPMIPLDEALRLMTHATERTVVERADGGDDRQPLVRRLGRRAATRKCHRPRRR